MTVGGPTDTLINNGPDEGTAIRTPKTSEVVADKIRAQIIRGDLTQGDTLPPEGQLMASLGISRPTLREAYRILEAEKLITVTRGSRSGAQVHMPRPDVVARYAGYVLESQGTTISDLYAAQMALEPFVVRTLCKKRSNKKDVARLRKEVSDLEGVIDSEQMELFPVGVANFHLLLVKLAGNNTLALINNILLNLIVQHKKDFYKRHPMDIQLRKERVTAGNKSFHKLINLIEAKEEEAAVAHWRLHLKNAHASWARPGEGERVVDSLTSSEQRF